MRSQSGPQIPGEADKTGSSQRRRNDVQNDTGGNRLVHEDACDDDNIIEDGNEVGIHTVKVDTADELQNECLSNVRSDKLVVSGGDTPLPVYEDMGDIVLQAAAFHQVRSVEEPPPTPPAVETQPVLLSPTERGMVTKITEVEIPSPVQPVLEYYEAKRRYLEAQEEAYGASSTKIQARYLRYVDIAPWCFPWGTQSLAKHYADYVSHGACPVPILIHVLSVPSLGVKDLSLNDMKWQVEEYDVSIAPSALRSSIFVDSRASPLCFEPAC